jgi:hypothetical protein
VIRNEAALDRTRQYSVNNLIRWAFDPENPSAVVRDGLSVEARHRLALSPHASLLHQGDAMRRPCRGHGCLRLPGCCLRQKASQERTTVAHGRRQKSGICATLGNKRMFAAAI